MGESKSQGCKKPRYEIHAERHSLPTLGAGKLSVALRTVNKEPGKKQGSKRNLNP